MKKKIIRLLQFILFLGIGLWLFWLLYKDLDFSRLKKVLNDVNYFWVLMSIIVTLLSYLSRTRRWILMTEPLGIKPPFRLTFVAIMTGYLANLIIPRMGEVARCGVLHRSSGTSFSSLIGTLVTERIIDLIMLLLLTTSLILSQFDKINLFMGNNPAIRETITNIILSPWLWILVFVVFVLIVVWWMRIRETDFYKKIMTFFKSFIKGLQTIRNMEKKWEFIFHSVFIWFMYFLMLYTMFFAFGFTVKLPVGAAFMAFILGSYGMLAPINAGIGAWHFMVIQSLLVFGVSTSDGEIFALLAHFVSTAFVVVVGLASLIALPFMPEKIPLKT